MHVVVVGANGKMGQRLVPLLALRGHTVTAFVRKSDVEGATHVVRDWMDNPQAATSLRGADSIVNLAGNGNPSRGESYEQANLAPTRRIAALLAGARAPHTIFLSYPGAHEHSKSRYLAAKAAGEVVSQSIAENVVILRTSFVCGDRSHPLNTDRQLLVAPGKKAPMFGSGETRCRPVGIDDAVNAIAAVTEQQVAGELALEGPDTMTLAEMVRIMNANPALGFQRLPGWLALLIGPLMGMRRDFVRFFLDDALDTHSNVFEKLQVPAHRLSELWALEK